ncbi:nucleotidyl transferase AbiEii/AbiGii toxin family protein [Catenuloplanes sp. NPDC051500]|uniref:nucleotidyl transferase AbiEii/AbiGii toxin family protein n=1 Tax=Catenuloplanes sp. NPDC051500 TaxID=3363959 RepID=UPI003796443F
MGRVTADLTQTISAAVGDPLRFQIVRTTPLSTDAALRALVEVYAGTGKWDEFPIDVSCEIHFVGPLEHRVHTPVLPPEKLGLSLPEFVLYLLVDQVADKVSAMYERHRGAASNRWRDLADLVLLVACDDDLDAAGLVAALEVRARVARSPMTLPTAMRAPAPEWRTGYPAFAAKETLIDRRYHDLDEAIRFVGECLDPVLSGQVEGGRWSPTLRSWTGGGPNG